MNKKLLISLLLASSCLGGCASTLESITGSGVVKTYKDSFSNEKVVEMSSTPNFTVENEIANTFFSAKWKESQSNKITLILTSRSDSSSKDTFVSFDNVSINIGGEITEFRPTLTTQDSGNYNSVSNTIYTSSRSSIDISTEYLEKMVESNDTKIKITTRRFFEVIDFTIDANKIGVRNSRPILKNILSEIKK